MKTLLIATLLVIAAMSLAHAEGYNHEALCQMAAEGHKVTGEYECTTKYVPSMTFIQIIEKKGDKIIEHYAIYRESI